MKIAYGTAAAGGSQQHTGSQLRVAGYGPGAANVVGLIDQTDNFFTIVNALELDRDLAGLSAAAAITAPAEVKPSTEFTAIATGFAGDRQVTAELNGEPVENGLIDVIDGQAAYAFTSPAALGPITVTLTGVQSGVVVTATIAVAADAAAPAPGAGTGDPAAGAGGSNAGPLALTGASVLPALLLALMLAVTGGVLVARRKRDTGLIGASIPLS